MMNSSVPKNKIDRKMDGFMTTMDDSRIKRYLVSSRPFVLFIFSVCMHKSKMKMTKLC